MLKSTMKGIRHHPLVKVHHKALGPPVKCGWGYRPSGLRAKKSGRAYLIYEDAPVRSLKPGYGGGVYGITTDSQGASIRSDLPVASNIIPFESTVTP